MNQLSDIRQQSLATKFKWGIGALAVILAGAVAWLYIASLAALSVAAGLTLVAIHAAPWASQKIANFFLDLRKKDARENPITNRERISQETWTKLSARKQEIETLAGEVDAWDKQINRLPADERSEFTRDLAAAKLMVEKQAFAWKDAEAAAHAFDRVTAKAKRKWEVAQTGLRIKRLSEKDKEDRINEILANEAADSVDRTLATAFTDLDTIVEQARGALTHSPSPIIEVDAREITAVRNDDLIRLGRSAGK